MADNKVEVQITAQAAELQRGLADAARAIEQAMNGMSAQIREFSSRATQGFDDLTRETKRAGDEVLRLGDRMEEIGGKNRRAFEESSAAAFSFQDAIAAVGVALGAMELVHVAASFDSLNKSLFAITGSSEGAKKEMDFVRQTSAQLGLEIESTAKAYKGLLAASVGTNLEGEKTKEIFLSVSKAAAGLGLSAPELEGALLAIQQMMSKGTVQAEELRGQLGERLPGAFNVAARAMGVSTAELGKMLQNGEVLSDDFLPRFAQELDRTFSNTRFDGINNNINRITNAWKQFLADVADSVGLQNVIKGWADIFDDAARRFHQFVGQVEADKNRLRGGFSEDKEMEIFDRDQAERMSKIFGGGGGKQEMVGPPKPSGGGGKENRVTEWKSELEQMLDAQRKFGKDALTIEEKFWQDKMNLARGNTKEEIAVQHNLYEIHKQQAAERGREETSAERASTKAIKEADRVAKEEQRIMAERWRAYSRFMEQREQEEIRKDNAVIEHKRDMSQLDLEFKRQNIQNEAQLGNISRTQEIQGQIRLRAEQHRIEMQALNDKLKLYRDDERQYSKLLMDKEKLEKKYLLDIARMEHQRQQATVQEWRSNLQFISQAFSTSISGMISGTQTFAQALQNLFQSILGSFINMLVSMLVEWIAKHVAMLIFGETSNVALAESSSALAAVNAAASVAAIPYIGWAMAGEVAMSTFSMLQPFVGMASAAGGFDIPSGVNPVTQLHQREMVLPSHIADPLRNMIASGGSGNGGPVNVNISSPDARSIERMFTDNHSSVMKALNKAMRNNLRPGRGIR